MKAHLPLFSLICAELLFVLISSPVMATQVISNNCDEIRAQYQCPIKKHQIHLSFDDGVASVTPKILDILKQENIKATFLILGNKVDCSNKKVGTESFKLCLQRYETLKRIKREGHDIGSHSYEHHHHSKLSLEELTDNIEHSRFILNPFFTTEPAIFRLPYGDGWFNQKEAPHVMQAVEKAGFSHLGWEMTAYDWNEKFHKGDKILDNVLGQMCGNGKRGRDGVVLFHDGDIEKEHEGRTFTANNLARWIPKMRCVADFKPLSYFRSRQFSKK